MNKYIILLIILLLVIIFYFRYKLNNTEKYTEAETNINTVIDIFSQNNLDVNDTGNLEIINNLNEKIDIKLNENNIIVGDNYIYDPSNNNLKCNNFNLDNTGRLINTNNNNTIDPSGNIQLGNFVYNKNTGFINNDNSIKINTNGELDFNNYIYTKNGNLIKKDNTFSVDPNNNINISDFIFNLSSKNLQNKDNSIMIDNNGKLKCGLYEYDKISGNKIKINNNDYFINNNKITDSKNIITIDPSNNITLKSKYNYNINNDTLNGIFNNSNFDIYKNNILKYNTGTTTTVFDTNNNTLLTPITKIVLEKPGNSFIAYGASYYYPLSLKSIRFYDYNDNVISPDKYTVTLSNVGNGIGNPNGATTYLKYYDINITGPYYTCPKVDSYSLYWNKTIKFSNTTPIIEKNPYLLNSYPYIGQGYAGLFRNNTLPPGITAARESLTQQYIFTFNEPIYIKYIDIEPRAGVTCMVNTRLYLYNNTQYLNTINLYPSYLPISYTYPAGVIINNSLTPVGNTGKRPVKTIEKYTSVDYNNTTLPSDVDTIMRDYIQ